MARRFATVVGAAALALVSLTAVPAAGTTTITPRAGKYGGHEAFGNNPLPVSFRVPRTKERVVSFNGQAVVQDGCTNHITSFQAPTGPMPIDANGRFAATSTNYPQKGVRVRVTGTFVRANRVRGHISVHIAKTRGCNARRLFVARHVRHTHTPGTA
jgi:hypothetical protein